jgi:hypothetical protein
MGKPNKPRIPAAVRHEVEEQDEKGKASQTDKHGGKKQARPGLPDDEDDKRLLYRGFEKSKLHKSRKMERKEKRQDKKRARLVTKAKAKKGSSHTNCTCMEMLSHYLLRHHYRRSHGSILIPDPLKTHFVSSIVNI